MSPIDLMRYHGRPVDGIIHVGANLGQERGAYAAAGASTCLYVEPAPEAFAGLLANIAGMPGHRAVQALCSDQADVLVTLNIASNGAQSSSILPLGLHATLFPDIRYVDAIQMRTRTLDELVQTEAPEAEFSLLVIDVQGAELHVLRGAHDLLHRLDGVFVEISEVPLYEGSCTWPEIVAFLRGFGFHMKWMAIGHHRYGDAFFLHQPDLALLENGLPNLALNRPATQSSRSPYSADDDAQGGNNGIRTGRFGFHTELEKDPWWQVDLGRVQAITEIRVFNRLDMCRARANSLLVLLSKDGAAWTPVHDQAGRPFGGMDGRPLRVTTSLAARFVRVQLNAKEYLHLDQVEVY